MAVPSDLKSHETDINNINRKQCNRWVHEWMAYTAWKTFVEHDTIEASTRNIIWGLHQGDLLDHDLLLGDVQLLTLICTVATDSDGWDRWIDEEGALPLEKAADIVSNLADYYSDLVPETKKVAKETEIQAVLQCCHARQFRMARDVLTRLWKRGKGDMEKETYRQLQVIVDNKKMTDTFVGEHTFEDYLVLLKQHLQEAFKTFDRPWLVVSAAILHKTFMPKQRMDVQESTSSCDSNVPQMTPTRGRRVVNLNSTAEDVESSETAANQDNGHESVQSESPAPSNRSLVEREMKQRLERRKRQKEQKARESDENQNCNKRTNKHKRVAQEFEEAMDDLDRMKKHREDNKTVSPTKTKTPPSKGTPKRSGSAADIEITGSSDSSDDDEDDKLLSLSKRLKCLQKKQCIKLIPAPVLPVKKRQHRVPWTESETEKLRKGVKKLGQGRWAEIKEVFNFPLRTSVQLKDRWRNITK